ncbi:LOW QUALITY PROTEIN: hypothetical protein U9M48_013489 [Paspalum notatum var. saurae]|uniref:hAT-like transposase RNase-H fold domain-containing protein n=1 Tax=Paspalum notatum var. saurae TaxID=547442 RepID=A0AAQ3WJL9_PASNO
MSTLGTSGSNAAGASESAGTCHRVTRARLAGAATAAPPSDSAQVGTTGTEEATEIDDDVPAGSKRRQRGPKLKYEVWKEFTRFEIDGVWKANAIGGETKNGTNHLRGHLEICPDRSVRKWLKQASLKLTANPKDGTVSLEKYTFDQKVARKELALMIIVHEYLCLWYIMLDFAIVSRNTIRKDILDMYEVHRQSMVQYFRKLSSCVAVTTDLWTANHQRKGYMAVTAHFLDDEWKLKSFLLRFIYVPAPHTTEVITDVLHEVLLDWLIERNLSTITLDNCSTNDSLMKNMVGTNNDSTNNDQLMKSMAAMEGKLPLSSCMLNAIIHMLCVAHILNLIVKVGMSVMEKGIDSVRDLVAFWSATPKRHEKFEKMAIQMKGKYEKKDSSRLKWQTSAIPKVEETSAKMKEKFNKYWLDVHGLMAVAAVLDPRYKLQLLNALFLKIHGCESTAKEAVNKVKDLLYNLVLEYQDSMEGVATTDGAELRTSSVPSHMDDEEDWIDTFDDYMSKQPTVTST